jgi:hypothetical protein|tara:strand:+ start:617 stop:964 length:348 start_codon:yes stop_codon:yes gene_type:complete
MTKQEVQKFRGDFQQAVAQLENQYGVNISLGTIRFDQSGLSAKMKAEKGEQIIRATKGDFQVGDIVGINHKTVNSNDEFEVIKINAKNVKVQKINVGDGRIGALMSVSPGLLVKK